MQKKKRHSSAFLCGMETLFEPISRLPFMLCTKSEDSDNDVHEVSTFEGADLGGACCHCPGFGIGLG